MDKFRVQAFKNELIRIRRIKSMVNKLYSKQKDNYEVESTLSNILSELSLAEQTVEAYVK